MKKLVTVSLFIFWAVVVAILVAGLLGYQKNRDQSSLAATLTATSGSNTAVGSAAAGQLAAAVQNNGGTLTLNMAEVAKHNSPSDCWMVINNKVYDVTSFLNAHPGGAGTMIPYCGKEASQAFATKDIGRPHSSSAAAMLVSYYVGNLNQVIGQKQVQQNVSRATGATPKTGTGSTGTAGQPTGTASSSTSANPPLVTPPGTQVTLNMAEIAKHNSPSDCWLLISGKVYNVTSFLNAHPGGAGTITPHCGQEATQAFNTKDIGRPHSSSAAAMLASYYIGDFNQTTGQSQIQQVIQQTNTVGPPTNGQRGDDDFGGGD